MGWQGIKKVPSSCKRTAVLRPIPLLSPSACMPRASQNLDACRESKWQYPLFTCSACGGSWRRQVTQFYHLIGIVCTSGASFSGGTLIVIHSIYPQTPEFTSEELHMITLSLCQRLLFEMKDPTVPGLSD